ncbi:MAG: 2OG-Fe(II) oxygenase [Paracoccaceae bacterium]|tara:strand:+ start:603 stop:1199 length:597 start_codon:yes stop_codon:yes gene_type:complete
MMQRIEIPNTVNSPNFISSWMLNDTDMCDEIVNFFEANPVEQSIGTIGGGINESQKKTTDISIKPKLLEQEKYKIFNTYIKNLVNCFNDYKEQWPFLNTIKGVEIGTFNLQKYSPGGHFSAVHTERGSSATMHRVLAFMTYLNDVEEGGETAFHHYDINVKPKKGKTIIWPAEWTHAHSGGVVKKGSKYIVTGWIQFA